MATDAGILQALWHELKPAIEARAQTLDKRLIRMVSKGKAAEAIPAFADLLQAPVTNAAAAIRWVETSAGIRTDIAEVSDFHAVRQMVWQEIIESRCEPLYNCRLFFDEPYPERIWLFRHGSWILYRWSGERFTGARLREVLEKVEKDAGCRLQSLLDVKVCGKVYPNPKLDATSNLL
jgi:hypothetical protein